MAERLISADALRSWFENHSVYDEFSVGYIMGLIDEQPTVEPTLYGYKVEHLALVARVMQKDGVTPEEAVQLFKSVQTIALKVIDEINGIIERTFEQVTETRGSVDAVPVVHGKWIRDEFGTKCGVCGLYAYRDKFGQPWESPYCPHCGADMRGEQEEEEWAERKETNTHER